MEPVPAQPMSKTMQVRYKSGGDAESGSELGDGFGPCLWIDPDPSQDRREVRIDCGTLIPPRNPSRPVHKIEILRSGHLQNPSPRFYRLNWAQPVNEGIR
jgi:hypothetical protein